VITVDFYPGCGAGISPPSRSLKKRFSTGKWLGPWFVDAPESRQSFGLRPTSESGEHAGQTSRNRHLKKFLALIR
jgi:hypothetical protein